MAAAFIAMLGVGILLLLLTKGENRSSGQYRTVMGFALIVLAECILYFYFYYADMMLHQYRVNVVLRMVDYLLYGAVYAIVCIAAAAALDRIRAGRRHVGD